MDILVTTWWGITIICIISIAVLLLLSVVFYKSFFKRFYDIVLSGIAILIFSPLLLLLTLVGAIAMKGNPFFVQARPSKRKKLSKKQCAKLGVPYGTYGKEKIIKLIKLRTMTNQRDENGNLLPDEQRLNKYGSFLRSTSLDELPSLINILIGDISIVGPRPQLINDMMFMDDEIRNRHNVRAGLTGLAQVNGRNNIGWDEKFKYDLEYINKISLFKDIKIILLTVIKVFRRSDINREGTMSDLCYGDWLLKEGKISKEYYDEINNKEN